MIQFHVNADKALEAIVYLANKKPNIDHYHIIKTIFYADKAHLNLYGRPIIGDVYKKMKAGPVPSFVLDIINFNSFILSKDILNKALDSFTVVQENQRKLIAPKRTANLDEFSETDIECLNQAFQDCETKNFEQLCKETHTEKSWKKAEMNKDMDYELFLEDNNPQKMEIIQDLNENSNFMVF